MAAPEHTATSQSNQATVVQIGHASVGTYAHAPWTRHLNNINGAQERLHGEAVRWALPTNGYGIFAMSGTAMPMPRWVL